MKVIRNFEINGQVRAVEFDSSMRLLDVIRDVVGLTGTKESCGEGECGACSVIVDGELRLSCLTLAGTLPDGSRILTIEGLEDYELGRRLQGSFVEHGAIQCGFCTPGMLMAAYALLSVNPESDEDEIRTAMSGNLCRCTGYQMIVEAVQDCAKGGSR